MSSPAVLASDPAPGVRTLTLNRPRARNAVDQGTMELLEIELDRVERDPAVRAVILTGTGDAFCSGGDLDYFRTLETPALARRMSMRMQRILSRFWNGDRVVIAAVNGPAVGGGCEIVTASHLSLSAEEATFRFVQAEKGIITGWGGAGRLYRLVGRARALELLLTARRLDAREAEAMGLIGRVVPRQRLLAEAEALASSICGHPAAAVRSFLELASSFETTWAERALAEENRLFGECWPEFRARLSESARRRDTS